MKRACLAWIGLYLLVSFGLAALIFVYSSPAEPWPGRAASAGMEGLLVGVVAAMALGGLDGTRTRLKERRELLSAVGRKPVDGAYQAFTGRIIPDGPTLEAPLTGRACVAYQYRASHRGAGKSNDWVTDAEGFAIAPSRVGTDAGAVRLLSFVELEFQGDLPDEDAARARLRNYLSSAELYEPSLDLLENYRRSRDYLLDTDGSVRFDHGYPEAADRAGRFEEKTVASGDEVVVFGLYSAERQGIVPDPREEVLHRARLRKGSPGEIARGLVRQAVAGVVVAILLGAAAWWLTGQFIRQAASP